MQIMPDQVVRSKQKIVLLRNRHLIFGFGCVCVCFCDLAYQKMFKWSGDSAERERRGARKETEKWKWKKALKCGQKSAWKNAKQKINGNKNAQEWMRCIGKSATRRKCYVCQRMLFGLKRIKLRPFRARNTNDSGKITLKPKEKNQKNNFGLLHTHA